MPKVIDALVKINLKIDSVFKNIEDIAKSHLEISYPEVPDPDVFIGKIEDEIKRYNKITQEWR